MELIGLRPVSLDMTLFAHLRWWGVALMSVALILVVSLAAMTQPRFATPVINAVTGDNIHVEKAWLRFPNLLTLEFRDLSLEDAGQVKTGSLVYNPFGILPGIRPISKIRFQQGTYTRRIASEPSGQGRFNFRSWVDRIHAETIDLTIERDGVTDQIKIETISGSVSSGDLQGRFRTDDAKVSFSGRAKGLHLDQWTGELNASGQNLVHLMRLFGIASPDTPPFDFKMHVKSEDEIVFIDLKPSRVGDSDIYGDMQIEHSAFPPVVTADLASETLDFDDLGIVFGIPIGSGQGETSNQKQDAASTRYAQQNRLIPNSFIDLDRLDAVDGTVTYVAESVVDSIFDVRRLSLNIEIEGKLVRATEAKLNFSQGQATAYMTMDATTDPAVTDVLGTLSGISANALTLDPYLKGALDGQFEITGRGNGFRPFASTMEGEIAFWSIDAALLSVAAEASGLDIGEALMVLPENPQPTEYTDARCLAVVSRFSNGLGEVQPAVLDTADSLIIADGRINMNTEQIEFNVRAEAKDASWGALLGDVAVGGTLRDPEISFLGPESVLQVGIAALLASASGPLVALPFIEIGAGKDAPCNALLHLARQ